MLNARTRIQNYLMQLGKAFEFPTAKYDAQSGLVQVSDDVIAKASSCLCNETSSTFSSDKNHGRAEVRQRSGWTFQLLLGFDVEVSLEEFEESLTVPVIRLPQDVSRGYSSIPIRLLRTSVDHPVQQESAGGSQVTMIFEVDPPRT